MRTHPELPLMSFQRVLIACVLAIGCGGSTEPETALRFEPLTPTSVTGRVDQPVNPAPAVRVIDDTDQPVPGLRVEFIVDAGQIANSSSNTDVNGVASVGAWTLGRVAQAYSIRVRASGLEDVVFTAIAEPGPPAVIEATSGNRQSGYTNESLPQHVSVIVRDAFANPVSGVRVAFTVLSGGGSIEHDSTTTDSRGIATSGAWTLGAAAGEQLLRASIEGADYVFSASACDPACQSHQLLFERGSVTYRTNIIGDMSVFAVDGFSPALTPDGRRLAFVRSEGNDLNVYVMDMNGSNLRRRVSDAHSPAWSPDGRRLAVARGHCEYECSIYVVNADDNSEPIFVAVMARSPAWSPDGQQIAFVSLSGDDGYHALQVMKPNGTEIRDITRRDQGSIRSPSWSPDGTQIAFIKCIDGCDVHVASADGSRIEQRTAVRSVSSVNWSPDGARFALGISHPDGGAIAWMNAHDGGVPVYLLDDAFSPVWLPAQTPASPHRTRARADRERRD